jgi:hypothetical protein
MSSSAITGPVFSDNKRAPAGTAAAPSFAFNDSTGTGVYLVSPGVLGLSTNGVQRVVVDASGNVGIGVTPSAYKLEVSSGYVGIRRWISYNASASVGIDLGASNADSVNTSATYAWGQEISGDATGQALTFKRYRRSDTTVEAMRIDASGNLLVGTASAAYHSITKAVAQGSTVAAIYGINGAGILIAEGGAYGYNAAGSVLSVNRNSSTSRSINAAGTINASGADYAEYMTKAGEFTITRGDLCGINTEGKLTNVFSEAVAFVVKSTNPSYVGGDSWGAGFEDDAEGLEAARQKVDRIAFCGQVPVNVLGATPGQWIIPVEENGAIKGQAVSSPSFEQYQLAVGKVIAIEEDGRARIIVKIA